MIIIKALNKRTIVLTIFIVVFTLIFEIDSLIDWKNLKKERNKLNELKRKSVIAHNSRHLRKYRIEVKMTTVNEKNMILL